MERLQQDADFRREGPQKLKTCNYTLSLLTKEKYNPTTSKQPTTISLPEALPIISSLPRQGIFVDSLRPMLQQKLAENEWSRLETILPSLASYKQNCLGFILGVDKDVQISPKIFGSEQEAYHWLFHWGPMSKFIAETNVRGGYEVLFWPALKNYQDFHWATKLRNNHWAEKEGIAQINVWENLYDMLYSIKGRSYYQGPAYYSDTFFYGWLSI